MGKKYTLQDLQDPKLPRITEGRFVHGHDYTHRCKGRGSLGYGYSAKEAYNRWLRNWKRRLRFYEEREKQASLILGEIRHGFTRHSESCEG